MSRQCRGIERRRWKAYRRRGPIAAAAVVGGAMVVVGALLPWLSIYAGLQTYPGVAGLNGRLLCAGGALVLVGGVAFLRHGGLPLRWGIGLLGLALLGFASWLMVGLLTAYRELAADPFLVGSPRPGLFVSMAGATLILSTFLFGPAGEGQRETRSANAEGPTRSVADVLRIGAALLSMGAAAIHFAVIGQHVREYWLFGAFFAAAALLQILWAVLVLTRPSRGLFLAAAAGNALIVGVWGLSRTVGLTVGPEAGLPESVGFADVVATAYEVLIAAGALTVLRGLGTLRPLRPIVVAGICWSLALAVTAVTAVALLAAVGARGLLQP